MHQKSLSANLVLKFFPGEKPPDPRQQGTPRLTRQGRERLTQGRGGEGEGEGKGMVQHTQLSARSAANGQRVLGYILLVFILCPVEIF